MTARQRSFLDLDDDPGWRRNANAAARRADAARRLPPYVDRPTGDALIDRDPLAAMTRRTLTVEVGRLTAWLTGAGVVGLLNRTGSPRQWDHLRRLWMIPVDRASDVLALAEHADKRPTIVVDVER